RNSGERLRQLKSLRVKMLQGEIQAVKNLQAPRADEASHKKNSARNPFSFEQWKTVMVDITVPIIQRNCRRRPMEGSWGFQKCAYIVERNDRVSPSNPINMPLQHGSADQHRRNRLPGLLVIFFDDPVITDNQRHFRAGCPPAGE